MTRALLIVTMAAAGTSVLAQSPRPTFAVASIKKLDPPLAGGPIPPAAPIRGGTLTLQNRTVASMIQFAYGVRDFQVVGGPDWVRKDLFDVQAKAAGEPSTDDVLKMLQTLLEDRFGLRLRQEQREMRVQALVLARPDGRPGPYLHRMPDTGACGSDDVEAREKGRQRPPRSARSGLTCGSMARLAETVSRILDAPVLDRTGLTGRWSANVFYAPDPNGPAARFLLPGAPDPNLPSFTTALQEQLGLTLEATRAPVNVHVIDAVRQPTEN